jgi:hypothetical protein
VGIITKPDLAAPNTPNANKYEQLIRGQESMHRLKLGWHVLRNRPEGQEDADADDRDAEEDRFFQTTRDWRSIALSDRGIASLRKKLIKVHLEHIKKRFPASSKRSKAASRLASRRSSGWENPGWNPAT